MSGPVAFVYLDLVVDASGAQLESMLRENVSIETTVHSDTRGGYRNLNAEFATHETFSHRAHQDVQGSHTITGIEGYSAYSKEWLLPPHRLAKDHFLLYLKKIEYRFNHRDFDQEEVVNHLLSEVLLS